MIIRPKQVFCADITCIPMRKGLIYLAAVMEWYSRYGSPLPSTPLSAWRPWKKLLNVQYHHCFPTVVLLCQPELMEGDGFDVNPQDVAVWVQCFAHSMGVQLV